MCIRGYLFMVIYLIYFNTNFYECKGELRSMFDNTTCNVTCNNRVHTMCEDFKPPTMQLCNYTMHVYNIDSFHELNVKKSFILGHNGLRNRIASRMGVVDMRILEWDTDLERMARNFADLCSPFEDDECANLKKFDKAINRGISNYSRGKDSPYIFAQNRYCMVSNYFPRELNIAAMREWYFDKNNLKPPLELIGAYGQHFKLLHGENNFTHLSYKIAHRFGCSIARYDNFYCTFCFYYPFFRSEDDTLLFKIGEAASDCPEDFPYRNLKFRYLCDNGEIGLASPCVKFVRRDRVVSILAVFFLLYIF